MKYLVLFSLKHQALFSSKDKSKKKIKVSSAVILLAL